MAVDIKRSFYGITDSQAIAVGFSVAEEGSCLVRVLEDSVEKVRPSAAGAGVFVGFAVFRQLDYTTRPIVEEATVPSVAPYVVELANNNLIVGQVRVHDVLLNADLTIVGGAPAAGEAQVDHTNGTVTFNVAQAGRAMEIYYRHNLTVAQAKTLYYEAPTNYPDPNFFASTGVGKGKGRIYTYFYDDAINWETVTTAVNAGANGIITSGGAGPAIPGARVVKVPTAADPSLGLEFNV